MILKNRTIPLKILFLEALLRRLPSSHSKYQLILEEFGRRLAGFQGEEALELYYRMLPEKKYMILHDLNLPDGKYNCQIDTLLLTSEFNLILEIKNMTGKLIFDTENEQYIQRINEKEKGFPYPVAQAKRHRDYLSKLLAAHHFPKMPIEYLVVISNSYASYSITGPHAYKLKPHVSKADVLLNKIQYFEKEYSNPLLSAKDLRKLGRLLIKMNTPPTNYLLQKYGIQKSDLLTGIHCPQCKQLSLIRKKKNWYCPVCDTFSKDAHLNALKDYFLLWDSKITNQEFRLFAHLSSPDTAKRLLFSSNLNFSGTNKVRYYFPNTFPW